MSIVSCASVFAHSSVFVACPCFACLCSLVFACLSVIIRFGLEVVVIYFRLCFFFPNLGVFRFMFFLYDNME